MKVVIVDDSRVVRSRLGDLLESIEGLEVAGVAEDAPQAKHLIGVLKPDIATVDIRMKKGDGIDLLRHVKERHPAVTVVVLTNYATTENRRRCLAWGADYFFDKSRDVEKLVAVMQLLGARQ